MEASQIIEDLIHRGFTKWKISKEIGVSWNTLRMWQRGVFKPSAKNLENLKKLYPQTSKRPRAPNGVKDDSGYGSNKKRLKNGFRRALKGEGNNERFK